MNWLDLILVLIIGGAAVRGFFRGFIIEACTLLGLIVGIWAGSHLNSRAAEWMGLDPHQEVISFIVIFLAVLTLSGLIGQALTKVIDVAQLGLPNKLAGVVFGALRSAFVLSILLNILSASSIGWVGVRIDDARPGSMFYSPVKDFAPMIVPALGETKWVKRAIEGMHEIASIGAKN